MSMETKKPTVPAQTPISEKTTDLIPKAIKYAVELKKQQHNKLDQISRELEEYSKKLSDTQKTVNSLMAQLSELNREIKRIDGILEILTGDEAMSELGQNVVKDIIKDQVVHFHQVLDKKNNNYN